MKPIMIDVFKLYDKLETSIGEYYRMKNPGGKYGATKGVTTAKDPSKLFKSKFYKNVLCRL